MDTWEKPYLDNKTTKRFTYKKPGIYIIRCLITRKITYVGMSLNCVYKAMYRHFQTWNDTQYRVTYTNRDSFECRVIILPREKVSQMERRLIRYFNPRDNAEFYESETFAETEHEEFYNQLQACPF